MEEVISLFKSPATSLSPASSTTDKDLATEDSPDPNSSIAMKEGAEDEDISSLEALPAEIINHILVFLPATALTALSGTSHLLRTHAHNDLLWSDLVRQNIPSGQRLESSSPAKSWRHLYVAHHPYWFLPRFKVWFADLPNTGKIMLARYNYRRGCIEAYQLIAEHSSHTYQAWTHNPSVIIHTFNPKVRLWTDDPVVLLDLKGEIPVKRLQKEVAMHTGSQHGVCSTISLCSPIPRSRQDPSMGLWPPFIIPAEQRVRNESVNKFRTEAHRPHSLDSMSDQTFRVRKWLEFSNLMQPLSSVRMGEEIMTFSTLPEGSYTPTTEKPYQGLWVGDYSGHGCEFLLVLQREVHAETGTSLESSEGEHSEGVSMAHLEDETAEQREAGIRLIVDDNELLPEDLYQPVIAGPSTEDPARMHEPESSYAGGSSSTKPETGVTEAHQNSQGLSGDDGSTGRLEAVKLTGDINVPRGQYTWIAEDIGPKGLIRIGKEQMFTGARIVKSWGRIAGRGFRNDKFIPSQLILVSHDTLAQYWEVSAGPYYHLPEIDNPDLATGFRSYFFLQTNRHQ